MASSNKGEFYWDLFNAYKQYHCDKKPADIQTEVNRIWNDLKSYEDFEKQVKAVTTKYLQQAATRKVKMLNFFYNNVSITFLLKLSI